MTEIQRVIEVDTAITTINEELKQTLITDFLNYIDVTEKTQITYYRGLKQFFKYLNEKEIREPQRQDIIDWKEDLMIRLKPTTVQTYLTSVKLFFRWLEYKNIYKNITENIKGVRIEKGFKKDYLTKRQIKKLIESIDRSTTKGKREYAILLLMLVGGLRTIEVHRANKKDLTTRGNKTVLYIQGKGKIEKQDFIVIPEPVEDALRDYLKARNKEEEEQEECLFSSTSNNNRGKRLTTRSISGTVKKALRNIGLDSKRLTAHSLRHTAVTLSLLEGRNIQEVQQFARHSNINTTQIYAHNVDRLKGNCENTIAKLLI